MSMAKPGSYLFQWFIKPERTSRKCSSQWSFLEYYYRYFEKLNPNWQTVFKLTLYKHYKQYLMSFKRSKGSHATYHIGFPAYLTVIYTSVEIYRNVLRLTAAPHTDTTIGVLTFKLLFSNQIKWNDNLKVKVVMLLLRWGHILKVHCEVISNGKYFPYLRKISFQSILIINGTK